MPVSLLADWGNFYVITGSSAAALTGLTFVDMALHRPKSVRCRGDIHAPAVYRHSQCLGRCRIGQPAQAAGLALPESSGLDCSSGIVSGLQARCIFRPTPLKNV